MVPVPLLYPTNPQAGSVWAVGDELGDVVVENTVEVTRSVIEG